MVHCCSYLDYKPNYTHALLFSVNSLRASRPCRASSYPPPPRTAEGGFILFVQVSRVPQKMSLKESLNISELFRLKDPKV